MPPQGRRNRDWSGMTEPLPLTRRQRLKAKRGRRPVPIKNPTVQRAVIPPEQPWYRSVPPWLDGPQDLAENMPRTTPEALGRAARQLALYRDMEAIREALAAGEPVESVAERYGVAPEDARRFVLVNGI